MRISDWSSDVCSSDLKRGEISAVRFLSPRQGDEAIPDISRSSERKGAFSRALAAATLLANRPIRSQLITAALAGLAIVIIAFVTREQLAEHVDERVHYFVTLGVAGMEIGRAHV